MKALLAETALKRNSINQRRWYSLVSGFGTSCAWSPCRATLPNWEPMEMALPRGPGLHCSDARPGARFFAALDRGHSSPLCSEFAWLPFEVLSCGIASCPKSGPCDVRGERSRRCRSLCPNSSLSRYAGCSRSIHNSLSHSTCPHICHLQSCVM